MKKLLYFSFLLCVIVTAFDGQAQIVFSKEYGGNANEDGRWVEQMPDSGYIMVGRSDTYTNGQSDVWVVRTDAFGNTLWTRSYGGTEFDFGNMIRITSDGGFIIAGFTNTFGAGDNDGWLIKTDVLGNIEWEETFGDGGIQEFEAVIQTSDGGYAALGINLGGGAAYYDMYLVKVDSLGNTEFIRNIGGAGFEIGNSIQQTPDGGFILAGQSYSYGNEDGDFYIVKTDDQGIFQWQKNYSNIGIQECHHIQNVPSGGFIMVGDADSLANGLGDTDVWLIRTNDLGDTLWTKTIGGTKKDGGKTVENTTDDGFIIAGISRSFGLINPNYYLVKTNDLGTIEWQNSSYGSSHHDHAYRGLETSDGGFAEVGYFRNSSNTSNYALVKLAPNGGVTKDIAIDAISLPDASICRSLNVPVSLELANYGNTNEANIIVTLMVDNGTSIINTIHDTLTTSLLPAVSSSLTFNETIEFPATGTYTLIAYVDHRSNDISFSNDTSFLTVEVLNPVQDPSTISGVSCTNGPVALQATPAASADSLFWFDAPTGGDLVYMGTNYTTPSLSSSSSFYVEALRGKASKVGPTTNAIGGGSTSNNGYLKFDSRVEWKLVSVKVYASTAGNRTIELRNSSGTLLESLTVNVPVGETRVYLNFTVPQGNDFRLGLGAGSGNLFRNSSGVVYPYDVSKVLEIYGSSGGSNTYYYFYDWEVFVPFQNCESNRVQVDALIGTAATTALDQSRCGNGTVALSANSSQSLAWYDASSGGNLLAAGSSYTTPSLSSTTTYYLEVGACPNRIDVQAIVNATSTAPTASNVTNCGPGNVTLTASASAPISWYDAASNGLLLGTGSSFITPYLNSTTTYYAVAGTVCPSSAVAVNAIINSTSPPTVTPASACGPASVTLSALSASPIEWYSQPTGGSIIGTGANYLTPVLSSSVTYYAQAVNACASSRVPVTAHITVVDPPNGSNASRCGSGVLVISATSIDPVAWYSTPSGGSPIGTGINYTTPILSSTTTYYAQASSNGCNSSRTPVIATVTVTTPPSVNSGSNCGPGTVTLSATSANTISWFDVPTGGSVLGTGTSFVTPSISTTTTYYAEAGTSCPSVRVPVDAVIATQSSDPTVTNGNRCGNGTVDLTASSPDPVSWYDAPNGNLLGSGYTFTTPSIASTTTYYAVAGITGCFSNFMPVIATVDPMPTAPTVTAAQNCGSAVLTLNASATNPMTWYSAPTGGSIVTTGNSYQATFNTTTTYYVEANDGTCPSTRTPVTATIFTPPSVVLGPDTVSIITGQTLTLNAGSGYVSYLWSTGDTTQSINVNTTAVIYVTVIDVNNCEGSDTIVVNLITGVTDISNQMTINVYPNPSSGKFELMIDNVNSAFDLSIMDVIGQKIFADLHSGSNTYSTSIDLSSAAKGIYFLQIRTPEGVLTKRILLQ
ncbi:MAG: T9SS type A sorting domain-containing protein [Bacteroidia bacterium]|nr:T9SS type A sorting domain-containing protein [Bacteroidia bacterium]